MGCLPLISIIIPLYNKELYIKKCLDSILSQTFSDFEIVIIDDGSFDNSGKIISDNFKNDLRIRYFQQENKGVSNARNRGIELSNGKFLIFIDADDTISPNFLESISSHLDTDDTIIIFGLTKVYHDKIIAVEVPRTGTFDKTNILSDFAFQQKKNGIYGFISNKIISLKIVKDNQIKFDEKIHLMEDYDFYIKYYTYCSRFKLINETGYYYTQNTENNSTAKKSIDYTSLINIHLKARELLKKEGCWNHYNRTVINKICSDLKIAFFNETETINKEYIQQNINNLIKIDIIHSKKMNDIIMKKLIDNKRVMLLSLYIKFRRIYIYIKKMFLC